MRALLLYKNRRKCQDFFEKTSPFFEKMCNIRTRIRFWMQFPAAIPQDVVILIFPAQFLGVPVKGQPGCKTSAPCSYPDGRTAIRAKNHPSGAA